jgi:hypothetical protein
MPVPTAADWRDHPATTLELLRAWAERNATEARDWYLRDKSFKRAGSRLLRALAILLGVAGGLAPLLAAAVDGSGSWGYILLAAAAGCVAFDHFFGLSSGWMRDMTTARALERRLAAFRFAWAAANVEAAFGADHATVKLGLELVEKLATEVADLVDAETTEWITEFRANITNFMAHHQVAAPADERPRA